MGRTEKFWTEMIVDLDLSQKKMIPTVWLSLFAPQLLRKVKMRSRSKSRNLASLGSNFKRRQRYLSVLPSYPE